jgi:hypothetical protein
MTVPLWALFGGIVITAYVVSIICTWAAKAKYKAPGKMEQRAMDIMAEMHKVELQQMQGNINALTIHVGVLKQTISELRTSTRNEPQAKLDKLWVDYNNLMANYTNLHAKYDVLLRTQTKNTGGGSQFTPEEIKQLIRLCHPDKHGNSATATAITQRLLELRK